MLDMGGGVDTAGGGAGGPPGLHRPHGCGQGGVLGSCRARQGHRGTPGFVQTRPQ